LGSEYKLAEPIVTDVSQTPFGKDLLSLVTYYPYTVLTTNTVPCGSVTLGYNKSFRTMYLELLAYCLNHESRIYALENGLT